jgi:hypothetical protein
MLLDKYMQSDEYFTEIESAVDANPHYKAKEKEHSGTLKSLNLDRETHYSVDGAAMQMMMAARELAYRKGFLDGIKLMEVQHNEG